MKSIGIDVGGTKIKAGLVSKGKVEKVLTVKTKSRGTKQQVINQLVDLIDQLLINNKSKVKSIGIGVPSIVDVKKGIAYEFTNIKSWKKVNLKTILEKKYKIPVHINNDANCFALGEKYFGVGKKHKNIVGIIIGTGMGAGIVINGKVYCGNTCNAGEFGRNIFKNGEVEDYCSGKFFKKKYKISGKDLSEKAKQGNKKALKVFNEYGTNLGQSLAMVVNAVDPELIVLGGSVSKSYKFFEKAMKKSLQKYVFKHTYAKLKIKVSRTKNVAVLGASKLNYL